MGLLDRIAFTKQHTEPPEAIDLLEEGGGVRIRWPGGREVTIPAKRLRECCPCAGCVEEGTGRRLLDPSTVPAFIRAEQILAVGSYAIQIHWSDGHSTGLYTWQTLHDASATVAPAP
jgi:DUF971 family protein